MTAAAMRAGTFAVPSARPTDSLTHVELTHIEKRVENWIRFGRPVGEGIIDAPPRSGTTASAPPAYRRETGG